MQRTDQCKGCNQVAEALNSNQLVPPYIPHALLHTLMQAPSLLAALRTIVAGGNKPAGDLEFCSGSAVGSTLSCLRQIVQLLSYSSITARWTIASELLRHNDCA